MSVLFIPQAQYRLDDALFWLKGWAAANADQSASADALALVEGLREVKDYLSRLADGRVPFVSNDLIVVSVCDLDGAMTAEPGDGAPNAQAAHFALGQRRGDHLIVRNTIDAARRQFGKPWSLPGDDETIPF